MNRKSSPLLQGNPLNIVITEAEMKAVKVARQLVERQGYRR